MRWRSYFAVYSINRLKKDYLRQPQKLQRAQCMQCLKGTLNFIKFGEILHFSTKFYVALWQNSYIITETRDKKWFKGMWTLKGLFGAHKGPLWSPLCFQEPLWRNKAISPLPPLLYIFYDILSFFTSDKQKQSSIGSPEGLGAMGPHGGGYFKIFFIILHLKRF